MSIGMGNFVPPSRVIVGRENLLFQVHHSLTRDRMTAHVQGEPEGIELPYGLDMSMSNWDRLRGFIENVVLERRAERKRARALVALAAHRHDHFKGFRA